MPRKRSFETNGAILTASNPIPDTTTKASVLPDFDTVASDETTPATKTSAASKGVPAHQTHGASFLRGPITSVQQLIGLRNVSKGSMGAFETIGSYRSHIDGLTLGDLHKHAVESNVVPIDDRSLLLRRLETEWTTVASRAPGKGAGVSRALSTPEKDQAARDLFAKMTKR